MDKETVIALAREAGISVDTSLLLPALDGQVEAPVQNEPLAWFRLDEKTNEAFLVYFPSADGKDWRPLYAMPRKPLTNEEISAILDDTLEGGSFFDVALAVARAIERAHGIGVNE